MWQTIQRDETSNKKITMTLTATTTTIKTQNKQFISKSKFKMTTRKFCLLTCTIVAILVIISAIYSPQTADAKKIKIKLKDLKKLKKYGYLLAGQSKKTYAIPFPVPLPVFIKRQQIYTQVPIVPRYVHQAPSYYSSASEMQHDTYGEAAAYAPEVKAYDPYSPSASYAYSLPSMVSGRYMPASMGYPLNLAGGGGRAKLFSGALGQAYPSILSGSTGSVQRDLVNKLLTGQAKVLSPKSLLSSLKSQPAIKQLAAELEGSTLKSSSASSSSSSASSSSGGSGDSSSGSSAASNNSTSKSQETKASASDNYLSLFRLPQPPSHYHHQHHSRPMRVSRVPRHHGANRHQLMRHHDHQHPMHSDLYRVPSALAPAAYPYPAAAAYLAALSRHQAAGMVPVRPLPVALPAELLQLVEPQQIDEVAAHGQLMAEAAAAASAATSAHKSTPSPSTQTASSLGTDQQEIQEPEASNAPNYEVTVEGATRDHQQQQARLMALTAAQRQRRQVALRLALLAARKREEAARLAESNAILVRAHRMGIPLVPRQMRLVNY